MLSQEVLFLLLTKLPLSTWMPPRSTPWWLVTKLRLLFSSQWIRKLQVLNMVMRWLMVLLRLGKIIMLIIRQEELRMILRLMLICIRSLLVSFRLNRVMLSYQQIKIWRICYVSILYIIIMLKMLVMNCVWLRKKLKLRAKHLLFRKTIKSQVMHWLMRLLQPWRNRLSSVSNTILQNSL